MTLDALMGLATLLVQAGDMERAAEVLTLVRDVARIDHHIQIRAEQLLAELENRLSPASFAATQVRGRIRGLSTTVAAMLAEVQHNRLFAPRCVNDQ